MPPPLEALFRPMPHGGHRLWLWHSPPAGTAVRGAVLHVHPWAEEMNKSRRMAAMAARALATDGWTVLQPDLAGCGDSTGELDSVDTHTWLADLHEACRALRERQPAGPLWLWGLRAGALWCQALASALPHTPNLLLWQPATQGKTLLQQFLRLKAAAQLADGGGKAVMDALRAELAAGHAVDIAGYRLGTRLASGLEAATLSPPSPQAAPSDGACRLVWLETSTDTPPAASPAAQMAWPRWQQAGWQVLGQAVHGPAFWQTTEIEDAPALVDASVAALRDTVA